MALVTYKIEPKNRPYKRQAIYHIINGIHSGIPLCCTLFFAKKSLDEKCHKEGIAFVMSEIRAPGAWERGELVNYVQCDRCYENNYVVTIKKSDPICLWIRKDDEY